MDENARPTLRQLEYFVAVAQAANFRRAAERLGVSQPTLTSQILALELAVGVPLFERSRAGTALSVPGRELLPNARRVLEQTQGLLDHARRIRHGPTGTYRLGVPATLGPYLLPSILPSIHERHAGLKLYLREGPPRLLESDLVAGEHDLILSPLPVDEPRLQVVPLFREPLRLVMSSGHRLADEPRIVGSDLVGEAVLSLQEHHHFHRQVEDLCRRLGAHVLRDYEGTSLDALRHMVVMGMGIAFLPALYVRSEIHRPRELRVTTIEDEPVHRTHALAWRRSTPMRGLFADLAAEIRGIALRELSDDLQPVDPDVPPSRVPRHERGSR